MKQLKTTLRTQLKQINLENRLHASTENQKKGSNDTAFQYSVDELKHCNPDMQMSVELVPVFLCLYSI